MRQVFVREEISLQILVLDAQYLKEQKHPLTTNSDHPLSVRDLVALYRQAKQAFDARKDFKQQSQI